MTQPEYEASVIFMRSLKGLHRDTMDMMRINVHKTEGTFHGAVYNGVMKDFLHHKIGSAIYKIRSNFKLDELQPDSLWVIVNGWLASYLDVLPDTQEQAINIMFETLDRDRRNQLIMNTVPSDVETDLKLLSGGRWQQEVLEAKLVQKCERSV